MAHTAATATLQAATDSSHLPAGPLLLIGLAWAVGYLLWCWLSPFTACRTCSGMGRLRSRTGRRVRDCRRCDGSGHRLRPGRHIVNHLRSAHRRAGK